LLIWLAAAVGLALLLGLARAAQGPLDDPDPAWQRPGFLDAGDLPAPAPRVTPAVPAAGRPTVVFFERPNHLAQLCRALAASPLAQRAATAVVVAGPGSGRCDAATATVSDPDGTVAEAYSMPTPRDGGPPVGYAIIDRTGTIRYRTLDPAVADQLAEVSTMVAALP